MPICFVVHLFITIVNDGYLSKKKKKKKTKKLKRNFVRSYRGNGWSDFLQIWYVDSPNWAARL